MTFEPFDPDEHSKHCEVGRLLKTTALVTRIYEIRMMVRMMMIMMGRRRMKLAPKFRASVYAVMK